MFAVLVLAAVVGAAGQVARAASFTVTNKNDSGSGSLRQAILDANTNPGADTITFAPDVTGAITLTSGELSILRLSLLRLPSYRLAATG